MDSHHRLTWLKGVACVGLIGSLLLSAPLWQSTRDYPLLPPFTWLPAIPPTLGRGLFVGLLLLLGLIAASPRPQRLLWSAVGLIGILCLGDQSRWHPWILEYVILFVTLALYSWKQEDTTGQERAIRTLQLMVGCIYLFSGLQKINGPFVHEVFPWLVEPITNGLPSTRETLHTFGFFVPFIEAAVGLGLLTKRFRQLAVCLSVAMHLFIFAMIGPLGKNTNAVVWPWTLMMIGTDLLLFARAEVTTFWKAFTPRRDAWQAAVLILFCILPLFSFVNLWDSYLSNAMYSGNITQASMRLSRKSAERLSPAIQRSLYPVSETHAFLNIDVWANEVLRTPPYPETRTFKQLGRILCERTGNDPENELLVKEARLFNSHSDLRFSCQDLVGANEN